ncbi:MAG TPA: hypothetical protein VIM48_07020 [Chthoniobacterales bacterium]
MKDLVLAASVPNGDTAAGPKAPMYDRMNTLCVPVEALGMDSEDGSGSTPPEVGDEVELTAMGLVNRIENGQAYIVVATVNDAPVIKNQSENADDEDQESDTDLADLAKQADQENGLL